MKLFNIFSLGVLMACAFSSCEMKKELTSDLEESFEMGALELDVTVKQPVSNSRAESNVPTNDFPVVIQGTSEGIEDVKKEYNTVDGVPETIQVPVGNYNVSSHTPGELQKKMDAPYYAGNTDITVTKDIETVANVVCKMANSRIQVNYGDEFKTSFKSWTITVDDGSETALTFTNEDENPAPVYWLFGENVKSITVNITATTTSGSTVKDRRVFTKSDASENYEDVGDAFTGGDAIEINMGVTESTTGNVTGITINANITFENHEDTVDIPIGPTPPGGKVTLNLPDDVTYSKGAGDAPASADAYIASEAGLDKIIVTIVAGNDAFQAILVELTMDGQSFLSENGGVDLIDNSDFGNIVATVGSQAPTDGCKEYTFPIGAFFTFLDMTGATDPGKSHEFHITVTDKNGNEATGVFKVTINEK
ncbi:DUF4493 domain-containing protein [Bacteroides caecigallinarum]|uniref:DUF4493 domain-containing protein n=1 Tax=Bacteroides caecigallinarum TaxID=1411144 RepID=UPI001F1AA4D1|nr:DUF4493 domain-containing protein [Bacteroides caecigallinarum]MCF2583457.1 DUF4493 domain-containing protein [Bacteroides caecigallinarum]